MKADVVVTTYRDTKMGFLFEDMNLTEAQFFCGQETVGSICTATVEKIVPAMDAAFLRGPDGIVLFYQLKENQGQHIILRDRVFGSNPGQGKRRRSGEIAVGDTLLVQIHAEAQKNKQAAATAKLSLTGDVVVVNRSGVIGLSKKIRASERQEELKELLTEILLDYNTKETASCGVIARTAAEHSEDEHIIEVTIRLLCKLRDLIRSAETVPEHKWLYKTGRTPEAYAEELAARGSYDGITVHTDLPWENKRISEDGGAYILHNLDPRMESPLVIFNIPVLLEKALAKKVFLKNGGYLYVEPTEAMTVIDVNSGRNTKEMGHEEGAFLQNLEAAAEIARLLRLRNISGMIMIDFISMKSTEHEKQLMAELRRLTANDPCHVKVVDITKLGILEMTREKKLPPLEEMIRQNLTD
ncbi:MAG: ribonuclease E/G [Eubacterium sp.]|nr:ribonuclease E/G [Eubacterium sp.]